MIRFADTFYFLAFLNINDRAHATALAHSRGADPILTTEWVLIEVADAMASHVKREVFVKLHDLLRADGRVEIAPATSEAFATGMKLYADRPDKDWSLTDCISFNVMKERGITEALTGDHHFEQAGFRAVLK
jgi:predicted nucleic acid-binding protein